MANAVIYARFSSSKQREESIEDQVRVCTEAAEKAGDKIVKIYADSALSGRTDDRPQFQRMIADSEKNLFQAVYIYKTDRFARNRYDSAVNKAKLRKNGVRVITAAETIPEGADGILMEAVLEGMAEYYSAQLAENIKRGIMGNAQKHKANGHVVYGYDITKDGYYAINKNEADVVRKMFEAFDATGSVKDAIMAMAPSRPRSGKLWTHATVGHMLRNPRYMGVYNYSGVYAEDGMPAIIDKEMFNRVQTKLATKKHRPNAKPEKYLLSGKLFDWRQNPYTGSAGTSKTGRRYYYYLCKETGHTVNRDEFDTRVAECCIKTFAEPGIVDYLTNLVLTAQEEAKGKEASNLDILKRELERNKTQYNNALDTAINIGFNPRLKAKIQELEDERAELEIAIIEEERSAPTLTRDMVEFWLYRISETRDVDVLISTFVSAVVLQDDGTAHIVFMPDNMPDQEFDFMCISSTSFSKYEHCALAAHMWRYLCIYNELMVRPSFNKNAYGIPRGFVLIAA